MIDWYNLLLNACWIFGCSVALAALSYASWEASARKEKFIFYVKQPNIQTALNFGGFMFCLGMVGTSDVFWQSFLWIILAVGFLVQIGGELYRRRNADNP